MNDLPHDILGHNLNPFDGQIVLHCFEGYCFQEVLCLLEHLQSNATSALLLQNRNKDERNQGGVTIVSKADCEVEGWHIDSMDKREEQPSRIHAILLLCYSSNQLDQIKSFPESRDQFTSPIA